MNRRELLRSALSTAIAAALPLPLATPMPGLQRLELVDLGPRRDIRTISRLSWYVKHPKAIWTPAPALDIGEITRIWGRCLEGEQPDLVYTVVGSGRSVLEPAEFSLEEALELNGLSPDLELYDFTLEEAST